MWIVEDRFRVILGSNTYINVPKLVVYRDETLFTIKRRDSDGLLGIDFELYDKKGERVAIVRGNRIVQGNATDYEFVRQPDRYAVSEKSSGRTICDIRLRSEAKPAELKIAVELYTPSGFLFNATSSQTNLGRYVIMNSTIRDVPIGIKID